MPSGNEKAKFWPDSFQKRRCIFPASAIQESQDLPDGKKGDKYEFDIPGREIFGMAGVWKRWKHPQAGQWESTFAVLTGEPNEVMRPIHDRLTTVLEPRDYAEYLAFSDRPPIHLLRVLSSDELRATRSEKTRAKVEVEVKGRPSDLSFRFGVIMNAKTQSGLFSCFANFER